MQVQLVATRGEGQVEPMHRDRHLFAEQARQKAVTFEEAQLCDSTFKKVDMSNVKLIDCNVKGMTIDGVLVTDLIAAYKNARR